jgi:catechol-2,3-dioxygenase
MKRFHVHLHVDDLPASIAFYSRLFSVQPTRTETDYAKWILEDPRVNFAISTRGTRAGLDHLGFQTDTEEELNTLRQDAANAQLEMIDEGETSCCYARSEKHWIVDPQGIPWEHFHTLGNIPVFNEQGNARIDGACCVPVGGRPLGISVKPGSSCC